MHGTPPTVNPRPPSILSIVWPLMRPYRWHFAFGIACGCVHGAAITYQNIAPKYLIDDILVPIRDHRMGAHEAWMRTLRLCAAYLVTTIVLRMIAWHVGYRAFTWARERIILALRAQFFRHVNHLCLRFHGQHPSGELFSYLFGSPLAQMMQFFQHTSMQGPGAIITLATTLAVACHWDPVLALVLCANLVVSAIMMAYARTRLQAVYQEYQQLEGDLSGKVADLLRGNRAVKLYVMEEQVATSFEQEAQRIGVKTYQRDIIAHMQWMKQEGIFYLTFALMMLACTWRCLGHHLILGEVSAILLSFIALQTPVNYLYTAVTLWAGAQASIQRIGTVLVQASTTPDPQGVEAPVPASGDLEITGVTFAYDTEPVLKDLTLRIPYGQRIAFVGPSGAGKSTISQLLLRLYDPQQGSVRFAGTDLRHLRGTELRKRFGVVPQDPFIFRTTVRDNIRVARPSATDAEIRHACEMANAWEFIAQLPEGLDTRVGEGGSSLSGGQRQRLAIARVLLANPPFFIFDEATSALDSLSEHLIQQALERNCVGRTSIFIAHRLATVRHVDRIIVMRAGRIEQDGGYDELVGRPGLFRELVEGQQLRG